MGWLIVYLVGAFASIAWVVLKVWEDGWDPEWSILSQIVFAIIVTILWPFWLAWIAIAVLAAGFERRY